MKLTIEVPCSTGIEMEKNLNRAIDDLSKVLEKKGFTKMELIAFDDSLDTEPVYKVKID